VAAIEMRGGSRRSVCVHVASAAQRESSPFREEGAYNGSGRGEQAEQDMANPVEEARQRLLDGVDPLSATCSRPSSGSLSRPGTMP